MFQKEAEQTLVELTRGLDISGLGQRTAGGRLNTLPIGMTKTAALVQAGSGLYMALGDQEKKIEAGSFWEVKADASGKQYLLRISNEFEEKPAVTAAQCPEYFPTPEEFYEYFEGSGGKATEDDGFYVGVDSTGERHKYKDTGDKLERVAEKEEKEATDHSEELQRRSSLKTKKDPLAAVDGIFDEVEKTADIGNNPPIDSVPEQVEMDVKNKLDEQGDQRGLSTSEKSDKKQVEDDLIEKGLQFE